jgi:hypothetical protein
LGNYFPKAASSRLIKGQILNWTGTGTLQSTNFTSQTYQVRVIAQTAGYVGVVNSTAEAQTPTTAANAGMYIAANTASGDFLSSHAGSN